MKNEYTLRTRDEFGSWLSRHGPFHDCRVLRLDPHPGDETRSPPARAVLELAYQIEGNYEAYSKRVSRHFLLTASGIQQYSLPSDGQHHSDHWSEGIEVLEDCGTIGFQIDVPGRLTLRCDSIVAHELPHLIETVEPWLSDRDIYAEVPNASMPSPQHWVDWYKQQGQTVSWHVYGGQSNPSDGVPATDYQGFFLQVPEDLDSAHQGIFFFACKPAGSGFRVQLENYGASSELWQATKRVFGQFDRAVVHCGNCKFTAQEWRAEVKKTNEAQPPPAPRTRSPERQSEP